MHLKFVLAFDPDCNIPYWREDYLVKACYLEVKRPTIPNLMGRMYHLAAQTSSFCTANSDISHGLSHSSLSTPGGNSYLIHSYALLLGNNTKREIPEAVALGDA